MKGLQLDTWRCEICGRNGHGSHFGAISCRACAAFFRRHAFSKYSKSPCKTSRPRKSTCFCKSCRLRKCYEAGMSTENFQHNRDRLKVAETAIPLSLAAFVGRSEFVLFCTSDRKLPKKTYIDMNFLVEQASIILKNGPETPFFGKNQLSKLATGFSSLDANVKEQRVLELITKEVTSKLWEFHVLRVAKWLTYFDEFRDIPHEMKLQLALCVWHVWARLDKLVGTARLRQRSPGDGGVSQRRGTMTSELIMDADVTKIDFSWLTSYPSTDAMFFLRSTGLKALQPVVPKLIELNVSDVELTWMLGQLSFEYAGRRLQGDVLKMCDRFQKVLSDDLHEYYVRDMRMPRYIGRVAQLMKINNAIQSHIFTSRPHSELGAVFNVFSVEFSHPEMFFDTGFG